MIDAALDAGITLFDTADIYGQGTSEDFIGRALEGRRDRVVLATKFGKPMDEHPDDRRGSRDYIRWAVEGSLRRLRTDVIDVYQMHEPDEGTPIEDTLDALHELVQEGIGPPHRLVELLGGADRGGRPRRARARADAVRRRRRTTTRSSSARSRTRSCPSASGSGSGCCRSSRSRAGC